jgi:septation ring formation regulator EzrA
VEFTRASSKTSEGNERINLIEKRISCLDKLVSRRINPEENERKITECYQQMDELLEEMTRRHQESVSSLANVFETPSEEV